MIPPRIAILNADGTTDSSFDPGEGLDAAGRAVAVLPSGKIAVGGSFSTACGNLRAGFAVLNADGSLDEADPGANGAVHCLLTQTDGKLIVGGAFTEFGGAERNRVARLGADLVTEGPFSPGADGAVNAGALQAEGKVVVAGAFTQLGPDARNRLVRLHNDPADAVLRVVNESTVVWRRNGSGPEAMVARFELDTGSGYSPLGGTVARVPGEWQVTELELSGTGSIRARAFPADGHSAGMVEEVHAFDFIPVLQVRMNERLLSRGNLLDFGITQVGRPVNLTLVLTNAGLTELTLDATPVTKGGADAGLWTVVEQPESPVAPGEQAEFILRFTPTAEGVKNATVSIASDDGGGVFNLGLTGSAIPGPGSVDSRFQVTVAGVTHNDAGTVVRALAVHGEGVMTGGSFATVNGQNRKGCARLSTTGSLLQPEGARLNQYGIYAVAQLPDGKWMIGGQFTTVNGGTKKGLARLNADLTLDKTFKLVVNEDVSCLLVQENGSVIVGGSFTKLGGKNRTYLARITPEGLLDDTWAPTVLSSRPYNLATQPDGKIYVGGAFYIPSRGSRCNVLRLNADGTLDASFNAPSIVNQSEFRAMIPDGAGGVLYGDTTSGRGLRKLLPNGDLDETFSTEVSGIIPAIAVQADGRILVRRSNAILRRNADGTADAGFVNAVSVTGVGCLALAPSGEVYVSGTVTQAGLPLKLVRLVNGPEEAVNNLTAASETEILWERGGPVPEAQYVVFDLSQDGGAYWLRLGGGVRVSGGWRLTTALPGAGLLRGRAYVGTSNGSGAFQDEVVSFAGLMAPDVQVTLAAGTAVQPGGTLAFPSTLPQQFTSLTLTIRNTGLAPLRNLSLTTEGAEWTVTSLGLTQLEPNQATTAVVQFRPSQGGERTGRLRLASNVPGVKSPYLIHLSGSGMMLPLAVTTAIPSPQPSGSAVLTGLVTARSDSARVSFRYRRQISGTNFTAWTVVGNATPATVGGFAATAVQKSLPGLTAGNYQFQVGATNALTGADSPVYGATKAFVSPL